jgi:DNA primase
VLAFDADEAGSRAAQRAILLAEQADLAVEVAELSGGKDPAELLEKAGAEALHKSMKCPINSFQFLLRAARARHNAGTPEGKKGIIAFLGPYLSSIDSPVKRDGYFRTLAEELGVEFESVREDFRKNAARASAPARLAPAEQPASMTSDFFFLLAVAANRDYFARVRNLLGPEDLEDPRARKLFVALEECFRAGESSEEALLGRLEDPELRAEVLARTSSGAFAEEPERLVRDGMSSVRRRTLERRSAGLAARLALHREGEAALRDLLAEKMHIDEELAKLKKGTQG